MLPVGDPLDPVVPRPLQGPERGSVYPCACACSLSASTPVALRISEPSKTPCKKSFSSHSVSSSLPFSSLIRMEGSFTEICFVSHPARSRGAQAGSGGLGPPAPCSRVSHRATRSLSAGPTGWSTFDACYIPPGPYFDALRLLRGGSGGSSARHSSLVGVQCGGCQEGSWGISMSGCG